jgi:hypothetical protein
LHKKKTRASVFPPLPNGEEITESAMRLVPVPLGFTYRIDFVPKGGRNPRPGLFRDSDTAVVRHIDADEAKPAFRVTRPELDILPLAHPRTKRSNAWDYMRKAMTFEILFYDGSIWWPNVHEAGGTEAARTSAENCIQSIKDDHFFFEVREIEGCYDVAAHIPPIRRLVVDERSGKLAEAKRKTYENVLICGTRAYYRGGMPIYFRNYHWNKSIWEIDIASVGPDRHGDPGAGGLYRKPGSYGDHTTEAALGKGDFWLGTDHQAAIHAAHRRQTAFPKIDVLIPEAITEVRRQIRCDSLFPEIANEVGQQIRLDSLFRETVRMFSHPFCHHWHSRPFSSSKVAFDQLCEPIGDDDRLSRRRLELLRDFVPRLANIDHWEMNRIRDDFISFDALQRLDPTWPDELASEDFDALASLAT